MIKMTRNVDIAFFKTKRVRLFIYDDEYKNSAHLIINIKFFEDEYIVDIYLTNTIFKNKFNNGIILTLQENNGITSYIQEILNLHKNEINKEFGRKEKGFNYEELFKIVNKSIFCEEGL